MSLRDIFIRGASLIDGTGKERRRADIVVRSGRIAHVGVLRTPPPGAEVIAADGLIVAPGFIDHHQHGDITALVDPRCLSALAQGVTSIVVGNCGHGVAPGLDPSLAGLALIGYRSDWGVELRWSSYAEYLSALASAAPAINVGALAAHGAIRMAVVGTQARPATAEERRHIEDLVDEAMRAGALGLSSGLEYSPGRYADTDELVGLCKVVARYDGTYASHIRNRAEDFAAACQEAISIAEFGGVRLVLSHLAPRPYAPQGTLHSVLDLIAGARARGLPVTIDTFPDVWGPSPLASLLPPHVLLSTADLVARTLRDADVRTEVVTSFNRRENFLLRAGDMTELRLTSSDAHPELVGMTLAEIATDKGQHPGEIVCDLLADDGTDLYSVLIQHRYATAQDLDTLMLNPECAFESDGVVACADGVLSRFTMNRSTYGYAPRVLGELVRERRLLSLEEAIRKMTSLPADALGLVDRGRIVEGAVADVVIFDEATVADRCTDKVPRAYPAGIHTVLVGGQVAWRNNALGAARAGTILRLNA